nr:AAA family ATPase [uncultured Sphingobacterium sp.]
MSFKIIAIRPLDNCADNILKNLVRREFYFFDNTYEYNSDLEEIVKKKKHLDLPKDFFSLRTKKDDNFSSLESINIHAIVGKNGSGKSSLIELLIRILNNFYKARKNAKLSDNLKYAKGVAAELYFKVQENMYKIHVDTSKLKDRGYNQISKMISIEPEIDDVSQQLFFTMYINYSLYGLDSYDFLEETLFHANHNDEKSWLENVFHKNDDYQTELVIHPWRIKGQIDIRNEKELMRQRLISQIILDDSFRDFTENHDIKSFKFQFKGRKYLEDHFLSESKMKSTIDKEHHKSSLYDSLMCFFLDQITLNNLEFFKLIRGHVDEIIGKYKLVKKDEDKINIDIDKEYPLLKGFHRLETHQLKEIAILSLCFQALKERIGRQMQISENSFLQNLFLYALVKLRKTLKYPRYVHLYNDYIDFSNPKSVSELLYKLFDITSDSSHISIKLRQAIEILKLAKDSPNNSLIEFYQHLVNERNIENQDVSKLRKSLNEVVQERKDEPIYFIPPQIFEVDIMLEAKNKETDKKIVPNNKGIPWKSISSGEFQKIGMISSLIYHLSNLDSVVKDDSMGVNFYNYQNINIILDEIDLYFHPEYQRTFVHELISRLEKVHFKQIKNINITFITHSPFILSDIPSQNVLKLKNGELVQNGFERTFAANIHNLLKGGFFMNGAMGEFAKSHIDNVIIDLKSPLISIDNLEHIQEKKNKIEKEIEIIGEPLIRNSLKKMWNERFNENGAERPSYEELLEFYKKHIES